MHGEISADSLVPDGTPGIALLVCKLCIKADIC